MANINLGEDTNLNVNLTTDSTISTQLPDINYIPGYEIAEQERRANEVIRQENEGNRIALYQDIENKLATGYFDGEDGVGLNYNWNNTSLGVKREDESEYSYTDLKGSKGDDGYSPTATVTQGTGSATITVTDASGTTTAVIHDGEKGDKGDKGEPGAIKTQVVQELPVTGSGDTIYLVPITPDTSGNNYAEYMYINNQWEMLGKIGIATDLTDYYTKSETNTLLNGKQGTLTAGTNIQINGSTISATDTTYQSKSASSGGTDVSLCTTGEKYTWNNKSDFSGSYTDLSNKPTIPSNDNLVNVGSSVDTNYRTNILSSRNLLKINNLITQVGVSITQNSDGTYTLNGTASSGGGAFELYSGNDITIPAGTYSGFLGIKNSFYIRKDNGAYKELSSSSSDGRTFTISEPFTFNRIYFYANSNQNYTGTIITPQLTKSDEQLSYEPLIQKTINVDGNKFTDTINVGTEIDISNRVNILFSKNLLDISTMESGYIDNSGNIIAGNSDSICSDYIKVNSGSDYTISLNTQYNNIGYALFNSSKTYISRKNNNNKQTITITIPSGTEYIRVWFNKNSQAITKAILSQNKPRIELGSTTTTPSINVDGEEIYNSNIMNYDTNEQVIGKWINGKNNYRKVVELGNLPNNTYKEVATGLTHSTIRLTNLYGVCFTNTGDSQTFIGDANTRFELRANNTIRITTTANYSSYTGYAVIEYTKTTD